MCGGRWIVCVLVVAACGGGGAAKRAETFPAATELGMFVRDTTWQFQLTPEGTASCTVAERRELDGGVAALIRCTGALDEEARGLLAGWWAATAAGVYQLYEEPTAGAPLDPNQSSLILASPPAEAEEHQELEEGVIDSRTYSEGAVWCVAGEWNTIGKSGADELCLDARGPLRGSDSTDYDDEEEGTDEAMTFTRVDAP